MRPTAVLASALVRLALVLTEVCSSRRWWLGTRDAEATLPTIDPEPTMVAECASWRPCCWLLGRARPSSIEGGRGKGPNPPSSGVGGSGGGGMTAEGGGTGECADAVTATIPCSSPRAIDRRPQVPPLGRYVHTVCSGPPLRSSWSCPGADCRESRPPSVRWGSTWGGACARRGTLVTCLRRGPLLRHAPFSELNSSLKTFSLDSSSYKSCTCIKNLVISCLTCPYLTWRVVRFFATTCRLFSVEVKRR